MKLLITFVTLLSLWFSPVLLAQEHVKGCIKYQRANDTISHWYKVRGTILEGQTINQKAKEKGYFANFNPQDSYYVVSWKKGGYSVLKLKSQGKLPQVETKTTDQVGKTWFIKASWQNCN